MNESDARNIVASTVVSLLDNEQLTFERLAALLVENGYDATAGSVRKKISRGSFSAGFLIAICDTLNYQIEFKKRPKSKLKPKVIKIP